MNDLKLFFNRYGWILIFIVPFILVLILFSYYISHEILSALIQHSDNLKEIHLIQEDINLKLHQLELETMETKKTNEITYQICMGLLGGIVTIALLAKFY